MNSFANTPQHSILEQKQLARAEALAARAQLSDKEKAAKSARICERLTIMLDETLDGRGGAPGTKPAPFTVAVYSALRSEVDVSRFVEAAYARGVRVVFPCMNRTPVDGMTMCMREVSRKTWKQGSVPFICSPIEAFEEDEPVLAPHAIVAPENVDMVIVPLVAFDAENHRLGYGGGNYDTFLSRTQPGVPLIGVAFEEQRLACVPCEPHDVLLEAVVSA